MRAYTEYKLMLCYCVVNNYTEAQTIKMRQRAAMENAPIDSFYYSFSKGRWITIRDLPEDYPISVKCQQLLATMDQVRG